MGSWAGDNFKSAADKNEFFHEVGRLLEVQNEDVLKDLDKNVRPRQILNKLRN